MRQGVVPLVMSSKMSSAKSPRKTFKESVIGVLCRNFPSVMLDKVSKRMLSAMHTINVRFDKCYNKAVAKHIKKQTFKCLKLALHIEESRTEQKDQYLAEGKEPNALLTSFILEQFLNTPIGQRNPHICSSLIKDCYHVMYSIFEPVLEPRDIQVMNDLFQYYIDEEYLSFLLMSPENDEERKVNMLE